MKKSILGTFITNIGIYILGFFLSIFITNYLGAEGKGIYALFANNHEFLVLILCFSIPNALTFYVSKKNISVGEVTSLFVYSLILVFFLFFVSIYFEPIRSFLLPKQLNTSRGILLLFAYIILGVLGANINGLLSGEKKFKILNLVKTGNFSLSVLCFFFVYYFDIQLASLSKVELVLILSFIIKFIFLLLSIFYSRTFFDFKKIVSIRKFYFLVKRMFNYTFFFYLTALMNFLNYRLAYWFISFFEDEKSLGLYSLAINLSFMVRMLSQSISAVSFPFLAGSYKSKSKEITFAVSRIMFVFSFITNAVLFVFADKFINVLYTQEFQPSILLFRILLIGISFYIIASPLSTFLLSKGITKVQFFISAITTLIAFVLYFVFTPIYGIVGTAVITSTMFIFMYFMYLVFTKRRFKFSIIDLYFIKKNDIQIMLSFFNKKK